MKHARWIDGHVETEEFPDPTRAAYSVPQAAAHWRLPIEAIVAAVRRGDVPGTFTDESGRLAISGEVVEASRPHPSGKEGYAWLGGVPSTTFQADRDREEWEREFPPDPSIPAPPPGDSDYEWL